MNPRTLITILQCSVIVFGTVVAHLFADFWVDVIGSTPRKTEWLASYGLCLLVLPLLWIGLTELPKSRPSWRTKTSQIYWLGAASVLGLVWLVCWGCFPSGFHWHTMG